MVLKNKLLKNLKKFIIKKISLLNNQMNKKFFKNKKVFITGGAGLLGISLTKLSLSKGAKVNSSYFNRTPPKNYQNILKIRFQ